MLSKRIKFITIFLATFLCFFIGQKALSQFATSPDISDQDNVGIELPSASATQVKEFWTEERMRQAESSEEFYDDGDKNYDDSVKSFDIESIPTNEAVD